MLREGAKTVAPYVVHHVPAASAATQENMFALPRVDPLLTRTTAVQVFPKSEGEERNTFWLSGHTARQGFLEG